MPTVLKSGSPNLLGPSGPLQTCNWIALPLFNIFMLVYFLIPVPVGSKVQVCGRSIAGISGSKPAEDLLYVVWVAASVTN